jgi:hypothetical protein
MAPAPAPTDTSNKVAAGLRYLGSNATGALSVAVVLGTLSPDQAALIISKVHVMYQATQDFIGAFASIWYIVFPILAVWLAKVGVNSSGFGAMMDKIFAAAKAGNVDAKVVILNAAASKEIGSAGVVNPEMAANPATSGAVVASPAQIPKAA